jgi:hypothetical protein
MKNLEDRFGRFEKEVGALEIFVVFLFILLAGYAIYLVYHQKIEDALRVFLPLGALISALLVAKVASRLLAHNDIVREDERRQDVVRITHHLLAVLMDLRQRVRFSVRALREESGPMIFLIENVNVIEKRYEVFLDREIYRFLAGETIELIGRMAGPIFSLAAFTKALAEICRDNSAIIATSGGDAANESIKQLESLLKDLDILEEQIRHLRGTLEPA